MKNEISLKTGECVLEILNNKESIESLERCVIILTLGALKNFCNGCEIIKKPKGATYGTQTFIAKKRSEQGNTEVVTCKTADENKPDEYIISRITKEGKIIYDSIPKKNRKYYYFSLASEEV